MTDRAEAIFTNLSKRSANSAVSKAITQACLMLPGAFAERYLRTSGLVRAAAQADESESLTRCCINFLFINSGHGAALIRHLHHLKKPYRFVPAFCAIQYKRSEPVRDNRSRTGSKYKQANSGALRASIFSAATRSFMDMIAVGTTSSAVLLCLMIAKYHTDVVAITPDQSASLGGLKSIKGQQKVHR